MELTHDGEYGEETCHWVMRWQIELGLEVDGILGPKTWSELVVKHE